MDSIHAIFFQKKMATSEEIATLSMDEPAYFSK